MAFVNFDRYFKNFPAPDKKSDFGSFWKEGISEVKKITLDQSVEYNGKKSSKNFNSYRLQYKSYFKTTIRGDLLIPVGVDKPKVIINLNDYNEKNSYDLQLLDAGAAYLFLTLRGHDLITDSIEPEQKSPGYFIENILERENYYVKAVYLDILRSIDVLRLIPEVDCSIIGIRGKGFGAAAAVFTAANSDRVKALFLDSPNFCHLNLSQNISEGDATNEINEFIASRKGKKKEIKLNLTYFDALNFSDLITCPTIFSTGLKNQTAPAECVFSLFNRLQTEKVIHVFPEDGSEPGGRNEIKESYRWLREIINSRQEE